jgi:hypothetical protein
MNFPISVLALNANGSQGVKQTSKETEHLLLKNILIPPQIREKLDLFFREKQNMLANQLDIH